VVLALFVLAAAAPRLRADDPVPGAAGGGAGSSRSDREKVDADVKRAEERVRQYETMAAEYDADAGRAGGPVSPGCLTSFDAAQDYTLLSREYLPDERKALVYQVCEALLEGSPSSCGSLSSLGGDAGAELPGHCRHMALRLFVARGVGSGAGVNPACERLLATPEGSHCPPNACARVCEILGGEPTRAKLEAALRSSSAAPSEETVAQVMSALSPYVDPDAKCKADCSGGCCDVVATTRARIAHDPEKCGSSALCRAAFGAKDACGPLRADLAESYCRDKSIVSARSEAREALEAAYRDADAAVNAALGEAGRLAPRGDEEIDRIIERAKRLRSRLDGVPKRGDSSAPKAKKVS